MLKINLETELLNQNKKINTPKELLFINEYEKIGPITYNDALDRIRINESAKKGERIKKANEHHNGQTLKFDQKRVFHISQIKSLCEKYHLRFLNAPYYKGTIDSQLPQKIVNFEIAYSERCNTSNTFIVAPKESFELQERPKDPLLFYEINAEYYYLIHKWGNDLSFTRRIYGLLHTWKGSYFFVCFLLPLIAAPFGLVHYLILSFIVSGVFLLTSGAYLLVEEKPLSLINNENWSSPYRHE